MHADVLQHELERLFLKVQEVGGDVKILSPFFPFSCLDDGIQRSTVSHRRKNHHTGLCTSHRCFTAVLLNATCSIAKDALMYSLNI